MGLTRFVIRFPGKFLLEEYNLVEVQLTDHSVSCPSNIATFLYMKAVNIDLLSSYDQLGVVVGGFATLFVSLQVYQWILSYTFL